jgi:hypothetical protein
MPPSAAAVAYEAISRGGESRLKSDAWMSSFDDHALKALWESRLLMSVLFLNSE